MRKLRNLDAGRCQGVAWATSANRPVATSYQGVHSSFRAAVVSWASVQTVPRLVLTGLPNRSRSSSITARHQRIRLGTSPGSKRWAIETHCRLTGVAQVEHLRASHCKPWRNADHSERLDGENGLLLTPNADHLFDRGFISFDDEGRVLTSPVLNLDLDVLPRLGIHLDTPIASPPFTAKQRVYLAYHRENVFLRAQIKAERKRRALASG